MSFPQHWLLGLSENHFLYLREFHPREVGDAGSTRMGVLLPRTYKLVFESSFHTKTNISENLSVCFISLSVKKKKREKKNVIF